MNEENRQKSWLGVWKAPLGSVLMVLAWVMVGKIARADEGAQPVPASQMQQIDLYDTARERPVKITVWYPGGGVCEGARVCLPARTRLEGGMVLSHGAMGAAMNYNWIGHALASQGHVVVGVNHYGESWAYGREHVDPASVLKFWDRPADIRFVLDQLAANKVGGGAIFSANPDWLNVTAIGHSSGGATMAALAGARFPLERARAYCQTDAARTDKSCAYTAGRPALQKVGLAQSMTVGERDARLTRLILMDPAMGHVVTDESLSTVTVPTLVIGSEDNDFLPYVRHAGFYADTIPNARSRALTHGEGHFVYTDVCDHPYKAMGVSLCTDRAGVDRQAVHQGLYGAIFGFLATSGR